MENEYIKRDYKRPSKELVEGFRQVTAATAHEAMGRKYYIDSSIRPLYDGMKVCGPALTCQCPEMDNLTLHAALHIAEPGDVIVCTLGDYAEQGPFGDCLATSAMARGIEGLVVNTCVRDGEDIHKMGFNVFCKGHCINGTIKNAFGHIGYPLAIGGQVVNPGDIIIGDDDGLVVVPLEIAEEVLEKCLAKMKKEDETRALFRTGVSSWEKNHFSDLCKAKGYNIDI